MKDVKVRAWGKFENYVRFTPDFAVSLRYKKYRLMICPSRKEFMFTNRAR